MLQKCQYHAQSPPLPWLLAPGRGGCGTDRAAALPLAGETPQNPGNLRSAPKKEGRWLQGALATPAIAIIRPCCRPRLCPAAGLYAPGFLNSSLIAGDITKK